MKHLLLTMMILFMNITLILVMPQTLLEDNKMFTTDINGEFVLSTDFAASIQSFKDRDKGLIDSIVALIDIMALIFDFVILLIEMFLGASVLLLIKLEGPIRLILGVPVLIAYGFAIAGWLK